MPELLDIPEGAHTAIRRMAFGIAALAIVLSYLGRRFGWLDYRPGGTAFDAEIQPIFIVAFVAALLVALRFELVGGIIAAGLAAALAAFAANQLVPWQAILVVVSFMVPALLWIFVDLDEVSRAKTAIAASISALAILGGFLGGQAYYSWNWGPTHPESAVAALDASPMGWLWSGAITSNSAQVKGKPIGGAQTARLAVSTTKDFSGARFVDALDTAGNVVGFEVDGLDSNTEYFYAAEIDGEIDLVRTGRFRTYPEGPASFSFAVGACARVGSNGAVFDTIRELDPLFYMVAGDLHYGDNGRDDVERYQEVMDLTLSRPAQAALYRSTPIAYMWDDHDYGGNDSDGSSPSRRAAMANYREYVPSYELSGEESAVYQAFTVGRVRFLMTDVRSARDLTDEADRSMLGVEQKAWLKEELARSSKDHALVVWLNPVPWVGEAVDGGDFWNGYAEERTELADHIAENGIANLLMISGDAHMIAADDGTNTDYSTGRAGGFPIFHAAALDRPGSIKGGPYTEGTFDGPGQFGMVDVADNGTTVAVTLRGLDWQGAELLNYQFRVTPA